MKIIITIILTFLMCVWFLNFVYAGELSFAKFHNNSSLLIYSLPFYKGVVKEKTSLNKIMQKGFTLEKKAVIHHTATFQNTKPESIRDYHIKKKKWDMCGYHFMIDFLGNIFYSRPLNKKGAHARTGKPYSRNNYVGIALIGNDKFTYKQLNALKKLIKDLGIRHVERHHEECPGPGLDVEGLEELINCKECDISERY